MNKPTSQRQFFKGAFLLTYAGLISKVLSAGYRIPLQNITGDVGFYVYQQVYPFIGVAMVLSLYGFPTAISRVVASQTGDLPKQLKRRIFTQLSLFSLSMFILIYSFGPIMADLMDDRGLADGIQASAFIFLLLPFVSCLRGQFQGESNMKPTALSQVLEQVFRVSLIIGSAYIVILYNQSFYKIGIGASIAAFVGSFFAIIVLFIYRMKVRKKSMIESGKIIAHKEIFTVIIVYGIAIAINHMLLLLLQFMDTLMLVPLLRQSGFSLVEAQRLKGILDRGQPLAQLGIIGASSMAMALIPSLSKIGQSKGRNQAVTYISSTWRFTLFLASGASVGLIVLFPEVNTLLFKEDLGTISLQIFVITIIFSSLSISTASILQGFGYVIRTALFVLIGIGIKVLLNIILVPPFSIAGSSVATVVSSAVILLLNLVQLKKVMPSGKVIQVPWKGLLLSLLLMATVVSGINFFGRELFDQFNRFGQLIYLLVMIGIGIYTYLYSLIKFSVFNKTERQMLPFKI